MARMTDEEADALDELATRTIPKLGKNGTGFFSQKDFQVIAVDALSAQYFTAKATAENKSTMEIIGNMVRKELAGAVTT